MSESKLVTVDDIDREIQILRDKVSYMTTEQQDEVVRAARWSERQHVGQKRRSGEPYIIHPIRVAEILAGLYMDHHTIQAGLLHDVLEDTQITRPELREIFGPEVEKLVNGVTKINIVNAKNRNVQESETIRKMFFAMVKDIRVILIKLADKRHNMSTLQYMPEDKQKRIARECLDIYAPIAGKLGIYSLKSELEDLSLKFTSPDVYYQIKEFIDHKKEARSDFLKHIEEDIYREASKQKIQIKVQTRAKHFYSIYRKMKTKGKDLSEIYDFLGIRILCNDQVECYTLLGIVHQLWTPLAGRFKDYIAMPKENHYKSLHTSVMGYGGKPLEIQIRTYDMNKTAEYGIAAHWLYKEGKTVESGKPSDINFVNQLKNWNEQKLDSGEFMNSIKKELLEDSIYVFTPKGDSIELPKGSTAIDFAYRIHTDVGHHCMGAKADGAIIPLTKPLRSTQTISVMTSPSAHPHVNWLRYVKTYKARSKIRHWLNKNESGVFIDRNIVAHKKEAHHPPPSKEPEETKKEGEEYTHIFQNKVLDKTKVGITIDNERNLMIHLAQCCNPTTGDDIIGFVSRGRGIIVHKSNCSNLKNIKEFDERKVYVEWETVSTKFTQRFRIHSKYRNDLFSEIEGAIRKNRGHLISGSLDETERGDLLGFFTVELERMEDEKKVAKSIRSIPAVMNVQKVQSLQNRPLPE
ncbi:bifunctional (p)ppGpp synthetase/guanosine-3',5'-bis(diphosphate) 3'-pyrophosphohydrolase [Spirochaeta isovalerica]|uniref:GTP pyrophosphokinase n=1 Tax=Spirochaeta isovalerica TaxID=150 RepID=A0A841RFQ7_9SPIO|nr:GTP pyrophosphokinase [Spirochaeta isovalerica]